MQNEVGKNIYYKKEKNLSKLLYLSYENHINGNHKLMDKFLNIACEIIQKEKDINNILKNEIKCLEIFDINPFGKNIDVLNNKVIACNTAIKENNLFETNKEQYLDEFLSNKFQNIKNDSAFEKSSKEVVRYLGLEKREKTLTATMEKFYELRQNKIREICKEFTLKRQAFLSQHINQEQKHEQKKQKEYNKSLER
ncbi:hypothetical protein [uncultured Brachyspira sp.]|jgi:hypothetical protein|uniref:hypothetical protein n=1 Tax=uncultured Brachyspira sp. TaxID=221953 RepID=UPI00260D48AF|nr:hypothetical protein [uncultured Brachyspira sp.]